MFEERHDNNEIDYRAINPIDMSDEEITAAAQYYSFDVRKIRRRLEDGDLVQQILYAHLVADHVMGRAIAEDLAQPDELEMDRMAFATKVSLASALAVILPEEKGVLRRLNKVRNDVAHNLNFEIPTLLAAELFDLSSTEVKKATGTESRIDCQLSTILFQNVVYADKFRQARLIGRLRRARDQAHMQREAHAILAELEKHRLRSNGGSA